MPSRSLAEAQLDALFDASPTGLGFWDTELRFARVNEALARINGLPAEDHVGRRLDEVLPEMGAYFAEVLGDVLRTGVARVDVEERGTTPAEPGVEHDWLCSYFPVVDTVGELIGVGAVVTDITERKAAERELAEANRRAASLARASQVLAASLDLRETLDHIAELVVPELADRVSVELGDPDGADAEPAWAPGELVVPLRARGVVLGELTLAMDESGRRFAPEDLGHARDLADRCALAVDNARLYSQRAELAHTLQRALLPPTMPELERWELATRYRAAGAINEVGGDFYDAVRYDGGWALVIGDVAGKGERAASLTAIARHTLHTAIELTAQPSEALAYLNERLVRRPQMSLCSAAIVMLPDAGDRIDVVAAGHPLPLLRHDGTVTAIGAHRPMLGAFRPGGDAWPTTPATIGPGDHLLLYTDGVLDAVGPRDRFGEARLRTVLERTPDGAHHLAAAVESALDAFEAGAQVDDVALLALRRR